MNRLATSVATGNSTYNLTFNYDRYGNMTCTINGNTNGTCPQWGVSGATNQLTGTGYSYDAAGDMTNDGTHSYQYDAEGRLISVDSGSTATYVYNALGQRVQEYNPNDPNRYYYQQTYYDSFGEQAVVTGGPDLSHIVTTEDFFPKVGGRDYVKFGGDPTGETLYLHADATGTTGTITNELNGEGQDQVYYPWGGQWVPGSGGYDIRFGSLEERDKATSFDPTLARQYTSNFGRWMTPDPAGMKAVNLKAPQSWNAYSYVGNNPMTLTDPSGEASSLCILDANETTCTNIKNDDKAQQHDKPTIWQRLKAAFHAIQMARQEEAAWLAKHPAVQALIIVGAIASGGGEGVEGEGDGVASGEIGEPPLQLIHPEETIASNPQLGAIRGAIDRRNHK